MQSPPQPPDPPRTSQPLGQPRAWGGGKGRGARGRRTAWEKARGGKEKEKGKKYIIKKKPREFADGTTWLGLVAVGAPRGAGQGETGPESSSAGCPERWEEDWN